jgi:hypothetical protein
MSNNFLLKIWVRVSVTPVGFVFVKKVMKDQLAKTQQNSIFVHRSKTVFIALFKDNNIIAKAELSQQ